MAYYRITATYLINDKMTAVVNNINAVLKNRGNAAVAEKKLKDINVLEHDIRKYIDELRCITREGASERIDTLESYINRVIAWAKTVCDEEKLKAMDDFMIDTMQSVADAFSGKMDELVWDIENSYRNNKAAMEFCTAELYKLPSYKNDTDDSYALEAGKAQILDIVKPLFDNRKHNILLSNAEFMVDTLKSLRAAEGDEPQCICGTYRENTGDRIDIEDRKMFDKVAIGNSTSYRVQNHVFDIVVHRFSHKYCYHDEDRTTEIVKPSEINNDLVRIEKYMREGGLLLAMVPDFLWRSKEIMAIRRNLRFLWSLKLQDPASVKGAKYTMVAFRYTKNMTDEEVEENFQNMMKMETVESLTSEMIAEAVKTIPRGYSGEVRLMSGGLIDKAILEVILQETTINGIYKNPKAAPIRPLLPLKKGQLGQMIPSGKLDGVIDEGDGNKHVIRGRVYKGCVHSETVDYDDPDNAQEVERVLENNLVEINVFAGDGTYKTIAIAG